MAVTAALAAPTPASAADSLDRARADGRLTPASYALERARSLFGRDAVRARWGAVERPDPHDATPILRDLRAAIPLLRGRERAAAVRLLARPSETVNDPFGDGWSPDAAQRRLCDDHVCVHWVETTRDAPPIEDYDHSGAPDWVETTLATFAETWATEVQGLGYAPPLSDLGSPDNGGDGRLDVYLADIGRSGYFGYCTSDDLNSWGVERVSAYCVLDNDFADSALQVLTPMIGLRVTAAHEFFHAVQFAYDWLEDLWFMEATAVWMEDEVFDDENDSLRYLALRSPLGRPEMPLDAGRNGYEYGAWLFWRYVSERYGAAVVRHAWERAGNGAYSLSATRGALAQRGTRLTTAFAGFGAANRTPRVSYSEGGSYPRSATEATVPVSETAADTGWIGVRVSHLANRTISLVPRRLTREQVLSVDVVVGRRGRAAAVTLVVVRPEGNVSRRRVKLDTAGEGRAVVPFGGAVKRVDVVMTNAGTRFRCWRGTDLSCQGVALDDRRLFRIRAGL